MGHIVNEENTTKNIRDINVDAHYFSFHSIVLPSVTCLVAQESVVLFEYHILHI